MNDKSFRPAVANKLEDTENIKILILAFPIWWYVAPTIINTFLEQYVWNDKIIIPVATSGSSGMGNTNAELESSCPGAILKDGKRFDVNVSEKEIKAWFTKEKQLYCCCLLYTSQRIVKRIVLIGR